MTLQYLEAPLHMQQQLSGWTRHRDGGGDLHFVVRYVAQWLEFDEALTLSLPSLSLGASEDQSSRDTLTTGGREKQSSLCNWTLVGNHWEQAVKHEIFILQLLQIQET